MAHFLPLLALLALVLFLLPNAAALCFRPRSGRRIEVNVSSNTQSDSNDANTTTTAGEEGPASNTTLPKECEPVPDECVEDIGALADSAHNDSMADTDKDTALQNFCVTDCGKTYTDHVGSILQGKCLQPFPSRMNVSGRPNVRVIVRAPPGVVVVVGQRGGSGRSSARPMYNDENENDDDKDNKYDDDDEEEEENDDDDDVNNDSQATTSSSGSNKKRPTEQEMLDAFHKDRPGTALGCIRAYDGEMCAAKKGCDFFNSCCYASWFRLGNYAGYPMSSGTVRAVEYFCPGSSRYLNFDGCT